MDVLKSKLREEEGESAPKDNEELNPSNSKLDEEQALIQELNDLREFVNNNKECIEDFFQIKRGSGDRKDGPDDDQDEDKGPESESPEEAARRIKLREIQGLIDEGKKKENEEAMKMTE